MQENRECRQQTGCLAESACRDIAGFLSPIKNSHSTSLPLSVL